MITQTSKLRTAHNGHEKQADMTEGVELGGAVGGSTAGVWQNTERYLAYRKLTRVKLRMAVGEWGTVRNTGVEYPARCMVSGFEKCPGTVLKWLFAHVYQRLRRIPIWKAARSGIESMIRKHTVGEAQVSQKCDQ